MLNLLKSTRQLNPICLQCFAINVTRMINEPLVLDHNHISQIHCLLVRFCCRLETDIDFCLEIIICLNLMYTYLCNEF